MVSSPISVYGDEHHMQGNGVGCVHFESWSTLAPVSPTNFKWQVQKLNQHLITIADSYV